MHNCKLSQCCRKIASHAPLDHGFIVMPSMTHDRKVGPLEELLEYFLCALGVYRTQSQQDRWPQKRLTDRENVYNFKEEWYRIDCSELWLLPTAGHIITLTPLAWSRLRTRGIIG